MWTKSDIELEQHLPGYVDLNSIDQCPIYQSCEDELYSTVTQLKGQSANKVRNSIDQLVNDTNIELLRILDIAVPTTAALIKKV